VAHEKRGDAFALREIGETGRHLAKLRHRASRRLERVGANGLNRVDHDASAERFEWRFDFGKIAGRENEQVVGRETETSRSFCRLARRDSSPDT